MDVVKDITISIFTTLFALVGAFFLFFFFALLLTILLGWILWRRIKKQAHEVCLSHHHLCEKGEDDIIIDVEEVRQSK